MLRDTTPEGGWLEMCATSGQPKLEVTEEAHHRGSSSMKIESLRIYGTGVSDDNQGD